MKDTVERFLEYISFDTQSVEDSQTVPSTAKQFKLAEFLKNELLELGLTEVTLTDKCYLYAHIPASAGYEKIPSLGFIAHLDTSEAVSGAGITPQIIRNWDGTPIPLGESGLILTPLAELKGDTIITTDGTTLLGADDKAGIAIIMSTLERLLAEKRPHGALSICFTPDEEIGRGADFFAPGVFKAAFAYTVDGGPAELIQRENFNAASARILFRGLSAHPGSAKDLMINAQKVAMEFDAMLPPLETPSHTEGREGFYHLISSSGNVSCAELNYILRDFESSGLERRQKVLLDAAEILNKKYGSGTVTVTLKESYRNMAEVIDRFPFLMEKACKAISDAGLVPSLSPIRGGTDGARLCFMGLPCPNLGYGGYMPHSETEHVSAEKMRLVEKILLNIVHSFVSEPPSLSENRSCLPENQTSA